VAGSVDEGAEAPDRVPGHGSPIAGPIPTGQKLRQLFGVEPLPARAVQPAGVEADPSAIRHHHQYVAGRAELFDVGGAGPAEVAVAAPVEQVQRRPACFGTVTIVRRQQQPHGGASAQRGGPHGYVHMCSDTCYSSRTRVFDAATPAAAIPDSTSSSATPVTSSQRRRRLPPTALFRKHRLPPDVVIRLVHVP
jgi:hypothetical protein